MDAEQFSRLLWWGEALRRTTLALVVAGLLIPGWLGIVVLAGAGTTFLLEITVEHAARRIARPLRSFRAERVAAWIGLAVIVAFWVSVAALLIGQRA